MSSLEAGNDLMPRRPWATVIQINRPASRHLHDDAGATSAGRSSGAACPGRPWPMADGDEPWCPGKERLALRSLAIRIRKHVAILAVITLVVAAGAAFGIWNL